MKEKKTSEKIFKSVHQLPKVHSSCSCKTFWSSFQVQLSERACRSYMRLHFTKMHGVSSSKMLGYNKP